MKKVFITLFFGFILCNISFAESYYFKECQLTEKAYGDYLIDFDNNVIRVSLKATNGNYQKFTDKIKSITKDQIVSEIIQSGVGKDRYFQYYLDGKSKSVSKLKYKKENGVLGMDGPMKRSYCTNVKADWGKSKKEIIEEKKQTEFKAEQEQERIEAKKKKQAELARKEKEKNQRRISISGKKWFKLSETSNAPTEHLKDLFNKRASELCSSTGNFDILEQSIEVTEIDETPTFGVETVVKFGIAGIVECK